RRDARCPASLWLTAWACRSPSAGWARSGPDSGSADHAPEPSRTSRPRSLHPDALAATPRAVARRGDPRARRLDPARRTPVRPTPRSADRFSGALALVVSVDDHDRYGLVEVPLEVGHHRDHPQTLHASPIEEGYEDGPASGHCCVERGRVMCRHRIEGGG